LVKALLAIDMQPCTNFDWSLITPNKVTRNEEERKSEENYHISDEAAIDV
jgi:hypothetical protein